MNKVIEVVVGTDGAVTIEGHGFKGSVCKEATKFIEVALGKEGHVKKKAEYFLQNSSRFRIEHRFGVNSKNHCG